MSQEFREKALSAAVVVAGAEGVEAVLNAAKKFEAYISGTAGAKPAGAPASAPAKAPAAPAGKTAAPAAAKPAATAAKPAATKPAAKATKDEVDPDLKKIVGDKVNELLKADKRDEAVALLASFAEATSATGIVKQGQEVIDAFMAAADEILNAAAEGGLAD